MQGTELANSCLNPTGKRAERSTYTAMCPAGHGCGCALLLLRRDFGGPALQQQPNADPPGGRKLIHVAHVAEHTENLGAGKIVIHPVTGDAGGDVRPEAVHGVSSEIQAERNSEDRAAGVRRQLSAIAA